MRMTEEMISGIVKSIKGSYVITYHPNGLQGMPPSSPFIPRGARHHRFHSPMETHLPRR